MENITLLEYIGWFALGLLSSTVLTLIAIAVIMDWFEQGENHKK